MTRSCRVSGSISGGPTPGCGSIVDHQIFTPRQGTTTPQSLLGRIHQYLWFFRLVRRRHDLSVRCLHSRLEVLQFALCWAQPVSDPELRTRRDGVSVLVSVVTPR